MTSVEEISTNVFKIADFSNASSGTDVALQEINLVNVESVSSGTNGGFYFTKLPGGPTAYAERMLGGKNAQSVTVKCREREAGKTSVVEIRDATNTNDPLAVRKIGHTAEPQKVVMKVADNIHGKYVRMYSMDGSIEIYDMHGIASGGGEYEATPNLSDRTTTLHTDQPFSAMSNRQYLKFSPSGKYGIVGGNSSPAGYHAIVLQSDGTWKSSSSSAITGWIPYDGYDEIGDNGWRFGTYSSTGVKCAYVSDDATVAQWSYGTITGWATSDTFSWLADDIFIKWPFRQTNPTLEIYRFIAPSDPSAGGTLTNANFVKLSDYQITAAAGDTYYGRIVSPNKKYFVLQSGNNNYTIKFTDDFTSIVHVTNPVGIGASLRPDGFTSISNDGLQLLTHINTSAFYNVYYTRTSDTEDWSLVETTQSGIAKLFPGQSLVINQVRFTADNKIIVLDHFSSKMSIYNNVYTAGNGFDVIETVNIGVSYGNTSYTPHHINLSGTLIGITQYSAGGGLTIYGNTIGNFVASPLIDGSVGVVSSSAKLTPTSVTAHTTNATDSNPNVLIDGIKKDYLVNNDENGNHNLNYHSSNTANEYIEFTIPSGVVTSVVLYRGQAHSDNTITTRYNDLKVKLFDGATEIDTLTQSFTSAAATNNRLTDVEMETEGTGKLTFTFTGTTPVTKVKILPGATNYLIFSEIEIYGKSGGVISVTTNATKIVDAVSTEDAIVGSGLDLAKQEVSYNYDNPTISSVALGDPLSIRNATDGYIEKPLSSGASKVTVRCSGSGTIAVYKADDTTVLAQTTITETPWENKVVLGFPAENGNKLRITSKNINMYDVYADVGLVPSEGYKYLGFYTTNITSGALSLMLFELIIDYSGGSIRYNSVEEIDPSGTLSTSTNYYQLATDITHYSGAATYTTHHLSLLFNQTGKTANNWNGSVSFSNDGEDRFYFYIELDKKIPDVTDFHFWTYDDGNQFIDLQIYGTNIDPATMTNMNELSNWTQLTTSETSTMHTENHTITDP